MTLRLQVVLSCAVLLMTAGIMHLAVGESDQKPEFAMLRVFNDPTSRILIPKEDPGTPIPSDPMSGVEDLARRLAPEVVGVIRHIEEEEMWRLHFSLGMWLRHNWKLWRWGKDDEPSSVRTWFEERGIRSGDDMSGIVLTLLWRQLNDRPLDLGGLLEMTWEGQILAPRTFTVGTRTLPEGAPALQVTVDASGTFRERGRRLDPETLRRTLIACADFLRDENHPGRPSLLTLTIRAHGRAPWNSVLFLLDACAHEDARVYRVFFEVENMDDCLEGYLAAFLPIRSRGDESSTRNPDRAVVRFSGGQGLDWLRNLHQSLFGLDPRWKEVPAVLRVGGRLPTEEALWALEILLVRGARWVLFDRIPAGDGETGEAVRVTGPAGARIGEKVPDVHFPPRSDGPAGIVEPPPLRPLVEEDD